jgi:hypothetical protein
MENNLEIITKMNELENKRIIQQINETKSWFIDKINTIPAKSAKRKKGDNHYK